MSESTEDASERLRAAYVEAFGVEPDQMAWRVITLSAPRAAKGEACHWERNGSWHVLKFTNGPAEDDRKKLFSVRKNGIRALGLMQELKEALGQ